MPNLAQLRIAMAGIVTDDSDGKPRTVRKKMRVKMGLCAPSVPTGITATLLAQAVANPGFITVLEVCVSWLVTNRVQLPAVLPLLNGRLNWLLETNVAGLF